MYMFYCDRKHLIKKSLKLVMFNLKRFIYDAKYKFLVINQILFYRTLTNITVRKISHQN